MADDGRMMVHWTDDYPTGHVVVWAGPTTPPIHLSFLDQQRRWRVNGADLALDPLGSGTQMVRAQQPSINDPYQKLLTAIGVHAWAEELAKAPRRTKHGGGSLVDAR
jgi:hypothetical protein